MASLFCRLFKWNAKPRADANQLSNKQGADKFQRSVTTLEIDVIEPAFSSEDSDDDIVLDGIAAPTSDPILYRRNTPVFGTRRVGGELRRSQTFNTTADLRAPGSRCSQQSEHSAHTSFDDQLRQKYSKIRRMHTGRMAILMEGTDRKTRKHVVIKAYDKTDMSSVKEAKMRQEQAVLASAHGCTGVVKLIHVLNDTSHDYVILEHVPGYTLIELMANNGGYIHEGRCAIEIAFPLLCALAALHSIGVVHRDIKPEHIMCSYGAVKLVDFCESAQKGQQCLNHRVGQLEYMAPEVLNKPNAEDIFHKVLLEGMSEEELPQYDEKADVWSAGVVLFEAMTGQQPFMAETPDELEEMQQQLLTRVGQDGLPARLEHHRISPLAKQFITMLMHPDPHMRPTAEQALKHPFITKHLASQQSQWLLSQNVVDGLHKIPSSHTICELPNGKSSMDMLLAKAPVPVM